MSRLKIQTFKEFVETNLESHHYRLLIIFFRDFSNVSTINSSNDLFSVPIERLYELGFSTKKVWWKFKKVKPLPINPDERRALNEIAFLNSYKLKKGIDYRQITVTLNDQYGNYDVIRHKLTFACCLDMIESKYKKKEMNAIIAEITDVYNRYIEYVDDIYANKITGMSRTILGITDDLKNMMDIDRKTLFAKRHSYNFPSTPPDSIDIACGNVILETPTQEKCWSVRSDDSYSSYNRDISNNQRQSESYLFDMNNISNSDVPTLERISIVDDECELQSPLNNAIRLSTHADLMSDVNNKKLSILYELENGEFEEMYECSSLKSDQSDSTTVVKLFNLHNSHL